MTSTRPARSRRKRNLSPLLLLSALLAAAVITSPAEGSLPRAGLQEANPAALAGAKAVESGRLLAAGLETPFTLLAGDELEKVLACNPAPSVEPLTSAEGAHLEPPQLTSRACAASFSLHLEPVDFELNPQRGPPLEIPDLHQGWFVADSKTRIGGFRLNPEDLIGGERSLSLGLHRGYLVGRPGFTEDEPPDPWGLANDLDPRTNPDVAAQLREQEENHSAAEKAELRRRRSTGAISPISGSAYRGLLYYGLDTAALGSLSDESTTFNPFSGAGQPAADLRAFKSRYSKEVFALDLFLAVRSPQTWLKVLGIQGAYAAFQEREAERSFGEGAFVFAASTIGGASGSQPTTVQFSKALDLSSGEYRTAGYKDTDSLIYSLRDADSGEVLKVGKTEGSTLVGRFEKYQTAGAKTGRHLVADVYSVTNLNGGSLVKVEEGVRNLFRTLGHDLPWDNTMKRLGRPGPGVPFTRIRGALKEGGYKWFSEFLIQLRRTAK